MGKRILVVEDEDPIRRLLVRMLMRDGFEVVEASDGLVAQEVLKKEEALSLIISDHIMPNCDGVELFKWVEAQDRMVRRYAPFIFFAGQRPGVEATHCFVMKPDSATLLQTVHAILDPRP